MMNVWLERWCNTILWPLWRRISLLFVEVALWD
jgi:hypothetical protein